MSEKLSKENKIAMIDYLEKFNKKISANYGLYNLEDMEVINFCREKSITPKLPKKNSKITTDNYFWFNTHQDKNRINDKAHHFLRHLRNAIAHSNFKVVREGRKRFFIIDDYDKNNNITMHGKISIDLLWNYILKFHP